MLPDGYAFRPLGPEDAAALASAYQRNREHLAPWDPERPAAFYTEAGQAAHIEERLALEQQGLFQNHVIVGPHGELVGRANLQNIIRGTMQGGTLGYWIDKDHLRRGLARASVEFLEERALGLGLHRLEAGTMVENVPSQRVLESLGYERYGLAPQLLFLNGAWRDHVLFQKLLHDRPLRTG
ncbi:MAG TPA: GNAT family protein [Nocardioides sp.]|nr:GNAT family protein [Nocardioides sp.]